MLPTKCLEMKLFWSHDRLPEQCPPKHLYALFPFPAGYVCFLMKCLGDAFVIDIALAEHLLKTLTFRNTQEKIIFPVRPLNKRIE